MDLLPLIFYDNLTEQLRRNDLDVLKDLPGRWTLAAATHYEKRRKLHVELTPNAEGTAVGISFRGFSHDPFKIDHKLNSAPTLEDTWTRQKNPAVSGWQRLDAEYATKNDRDSDRDKCVLHKLGESKGITVKFGRCYLLESVQFTLWDGNWRFYCYYVETSMNGKVWKRVIDKSSVESRGLQNLNFDMHPATYIRIVGTSSVTEFFDIYNFQCPATE
ncbi:hypothetical protein QR680_007071 [Steinernema hermaphroditum]|uniref:F5/8 type C domain-containing protein n=1 Tax=Steinernema hermaphroditum TaxID=289476 RepID=A0AA39LY62_9BILA|nr:hypothetical protein QR680_007071 [Steinernema hermaphroditum]